MKRGLKALGGTVALMAAQIAVQQVLAHVVLPWCEERWEDHERKRANPIGFAKAQPTKRRRR